MKKNKTFFEQMGEVFTEKDFTTKAPFFTNRVLSFQPGTISLSVDINRRLSNLPLWATDAIFNHCVKKRRSTPYIYYPKSKKIKKDQKVLRRKISSVFNTNDKHSDQIIELLKRMKVDASSYFGMKK